MRCFYGEQISVIIDEYGCFQGILTLEDVIETLIGDEIVDEMDTVRDMQQLAREKREKPAALFLFRNVLQNTLHKFPTLIHSVDLHSLIR